MPPRSRSRGRSRSRSRGRSPSRARSRSRSRSREAKTEKAKPVKAPSTLDRATSRAIVLLEGISVKGKDIRQFLGVLGEDLRRSENRISIEEFENVYMTWVVRGLDNEYASAFRTSLNSQLKKLEGKPEVSLEEDCCCYTYSLKTV